MSFSKNIKEDILVASARHCCVCHRYKGVKIEIHHILPKHKGGLDTFENAIPLCFDCHSDAGHYNSKHPKGTKFSIEELKKHKKNWFNIVKKNSIPQKTENQIHSRYLITKEFDFIKDLSKKDLSKFPIDNCLLLDNDSLKMFKDLFFNQHERELEITNPIELTPNEYELSFPDAVKVSNIEGSYYFFHHQRTPSIKEISSTCKKDNLSLFLAQHSISPERIAKINTCFGSECGERGSFEELYQLRPLYFKFLVLTNISDTHIKAINLTTDKHNGILYSNCEIKGKHVMEFPRILIAPNQSIIIPLGMFLAEFDDLEKAENFTRLSEIRGDRSVVFDHTVYNKKQKIEYIGINYLPISLKYEQTNKIYTQDLHPFDFENLYWVDSFWNCGSCPHLFYISTANDIIYKGEIFDTSPNIETTLYLEIEDDIKQIIVAELEHEYTTINSIYKNGIKIATNIQLEINQDIRIDVKRLDKILISGFYSTISNMSIKLPITKKNSIIEKYKKVYMNYKVMPSASINTKQVKLKSSLTNN